MLSRRSFVRQAGVLAGAVTLGTKEAAAVSAETPVPTPPPESALPPVQTLPPATPGGLPRRILGRTNVPLCMFTLGTAPCGYLPPPKIAELVNVALDEGVTAVDTSEMYQNSQEGVGLALGKRRKDVFLSTKVFANSIAEAERSLAKSIKLLRTDYFDVLYYHGLGNLNIAGAREPDGVFTWLLKQKKAGKCQFVGVSGHNLAARFPQFLESGDVDVLLVIVNFADRHTYHFEEEVLPVARKHNVGIVAMKVFGGAANMDYKNPKRPQIDSQYVPLALRYALSTPGVVSADLGVHTAEQIRSNVQMIKDFRLLSPEETAHAIDLGKGLAAKWGEHFGPAREKAPA
jgi:predicted aldo/keto reductase-like oxidoreductase